LSCEIKNFSPKKLLVFEESSYLCSTSTRQASQRCSNVRVVLFLLHFPCWDSRIFKRFLFLCEYWKYGRKR